VDGETLTLDAIKSGLKFRKALAKALLGEIRNIQVASEHRPFDVWALVLLRSIGDPKAQVEVEKVSSPRAWQRPPPPRRGFSAACGTHLFQNLNRC
jgi:hypothetical protein